MEQAASYPLRQAHEAVRLSDGGPILEPGCGAGRVVLRLNRDGCRVFASDRVRGVLSALKRSCSVPLDCSSVTHMPYQRDTFSLLLCFGLFHNLRGDDLEQAVAESRRVLRPGGVICASFRADNLQTRLTDWLAQRRARDRAGRLVFHKLNLTRDEVRQLFERHGFRTTRIDCVENMPWFYKFRVFRHASQKDFDEVVARRDGYRLNAAGRALQSLILGLAPRSFCNVYVYFGVKP